MNPDTIHSIVTGTPIMLESLTNILSIITQIAGIFAVVGFGIWALFTFFFKEWIAAQFNKKFEEIKLEHLKDIKKLDATIQLKTEADIRNRTELFNRVSHAWALLSEGVSLIDSFTHGHYKEPNDVYVPYFGNMKDDEIEKYLQESNFDTIDISTIIKSGSNKLGPVVRHTAILKSYKQVKPLRDKKRVMSVTRQIRLNANENALYYGSDIADRFIGLSGLIFACSQTMDAQGNSDSMNDAWQAFRDEVLPSKQDLGKLIRERVGMDNSFGSSEAPR